MSIHKTQEKNACCKFAPIHRMNIYSSLLFSGLQGLYSSSSASSIVSSSLSTISPTDSYSTRTSDSTAQSSPPCSTKGELFIEGNRQSSVFRTNNVGYGAETACRTPSPIIRKTDQTVADPRIGLRSTVPCGVVSPGSSPARYKSATGHAPQRPSLLRMTANVQDTVIPTIDEDAPGVRAPVQCWADCDQGRTLDKSKFLPQTLEHKINEGQPNRYSSPRDIAYHMAAGNLSLNCGAQGDGHSKGIMRSGNNHPNKDMAYVACRAMDTHDTSDHYEPATSTLGHESLPYNTAAGDGKVARQGLYNPSQLQNQRSTSRSSSLQVHGYEMKQQKGPMLHQQSAMKPPESVSSLSLAAAKKDYVRINYSNGWETCSNSISIQGLYSIRPLSTFAVDDHAWDQGSRILAKAAQDAQHKAESDIITGRKPTMSMRRAHSDISHHSRSPPVMSRSSSGPNTRYFDPRTGERRKTLFQIMEEREARDNLKEEEEDRGRSKRGAWYPVP